MASPSVLAAPVRVPLAKHISAYWTPKFVCSDDPELVIFLGPPTILPTHWNRKTRRRVLCVGDGCSHCEAESLTSEGVRIKPYYYAPALVRKTVAQVEVRRWERVAYALSGVAAENKCGASRIVRGSLFSVWRSANGNNAEIEASFEREVYKLEEPAFDVMPIMLNIWFPSQESRARLLDHLRTLPVEITEPVLEKPRIVAPPESPSVPTSTETLSKAFFEQFISASAEQQRNYLQMFPVLAKEVAKQVAQEMRQEGKEETAKAETLSPGAQKMEKVIAEHHKNKTLSHEGKTIPIPPDPKPNPEPIGDSLRGMPRNERGAA